jgi:hypothetical protein
MACSLNDFCGDTRTILKAGCRREMIEQVRVCMERLVVDPQFVAEYFAEQQSLGLKRIFFDPELGFELMTYRFDKARASQPHDHGNSWAIYAQVREYTDMMEWERVDDGSNPAAATLKVKREYRLNPGHAGVYFARELHSTATPPGTRYLRITGTDLDVIERLRIDAATGRVEHVHGRQLSEQA